MCTGFWWGYLRERDHLEDPGLDGRIILGQIFRRLVGGMSWIDCDNFYEVSSLLILV